MLDRLRIAMEHHHARFIATGQRPFRNQRFWQWIIIIAQLRAHGARSNHLPIRAKLPNMRLMQFPQALETVLQTLERIREEGAHRPCASRSALKMLDRAAPIRASQPVPESKIDPPSPSLRRAGIDKIEKLAAIQERVSVCTKCPNLASSRTQTVFGVGNPDAEIMFVGEAPGADEDAQGEPFVGRAGQLLTKIIRAMGFAREDV